MGNALVWLVKDAFEEVFSNIRRPATWIVAFPLFAIAGTIAYTDFEYGKQAREIHSLYQKSTLSEKLLASPHGTWPHLTVCEELQQLEQSGVHPEHWAVDLFKKAGHDFYVVQHWFYRASR